MYKQFITANVDKSWHEILKTALAAMDQGYLQDLIANPNWLPGIDNIFSAFSLPVSQTKYILFGESPYPRKESANGHAFWDAAVKEIWSATGFSKPVNRATSLRNIIKMLLLADNKLTAADTSQAAIAKLEKTHYINTLADLFNNLHRHGFLLLNATLVLHKNQVKIDGRYWLVFIESLLNQLQNKSIELILFGKVAQLIEQVPATQPFKKLHAEHPYNLSFITNPKVVAFFKQFSLLNLN